MNEEIKKRCNACGLHKPLSDFHKYVGKTARSVDGHRAECKKCRNRKQLERYYASKAV